MNERVVVPDSPTMWSAQELGDLVGMTPHAVRWHLRKLKERPLSEPFPDNYPFPLDREQAQRLLDYIARRPKRRGCKRRQRR